MGRKKTRRQCHGLPWHWKQTDSWYYTLPGTKKRVPLFDEEGQRIRGKENKQSAQRALARVRLAGDDGVSAAPVSPEAWLVAKVCSEYLQYCERGVANGTVSADHRYATSWVVNDLCQYYGALPVTQFKKAHLQTWLEKHPRWRSPATHRSVLTIVLAAFNYAADNYGIANPLQGFKKPSPQPRLHSLPQEDEKAMYEATDQPFRDFLFAALHTGLRPFCELARLTAEDVIDTPRGLMWRVFSSKTKKTRKIPVRPEVATLTARLLKTAPPGSGLPLFRNSRGKPWKKVTGVLRFIKLRRKLGWDQDPVRKRYSCYSCRHTFAHRMLSGYWNGGAGCSIETLAELMGDTPKVAFDHYGKEWGQNYQEPLWAAIGMQRQSSDRPSAGKGSKKRSGNKAPGERKRHRSKS